MTIEITEQEKLILRSVTIPPRPEALLKFSEEAKKEEPNIEVLARAITSDVAISAAILQVVNSAAFSTVKEIESINQAIMVLGLKRLIPLVKSVALKSAVQAGAELSNFWQEQSDIATACSLVANELSKPDIANHCYMLGLFHAAGIPILYQHFDDYSEVLSFASENGWDEGVQFEYNRYQTSHTSIGAVLANQWKLPPAMTKVIYYQHDVGGIFESGELNDTALTLLSILKIGIFCVESKDTMEDVNPDWENIKDVLCDYLDVSETEVLELKDKITGSL